MCLNVVTGELRWEVNLKSGFSAHEPGYGFVASPLLLDE